MKKRTILIFTILMVGSLFFAQKDSMAASLRATKTKIENGSTAKINLYFYYGKTKVKWSVSNKKAKIISKGKKWCKIKAKKPGTVYVKCKIGKKTYKKKITIKPKSKVTYGNYDLLYAGMTYDEVADIIGYYDDISYSEMHTQEEYEQYYQWNLEDGGGWEKYLYYEQIRYVWRNPWNYHYIYCTFNDGVLVEKSYQ